MVVLSCSGIALALETSTGSVRWKYDTRADGAAAQFHGDPLVIGERILFGSDGVDRGFVYSFSASSGQLEWKREFDGGVPTDLIGFENMVIGASGRGDFFALDSADGFVWWLVHPEHYRFAANQRVQSPFLQDETIYFPGPDGSVYSIEAPSGTVNWRTSLGGPISTSVVVNGGVVYAGTSGGHLKALDSETGSARETIHLDASPFGILQSSGSRIYVFSSRDRGTLHAFEGTTEIWNQPGEWSSFRALFTRFGLVAGSSDGSITVLDPVNGKRLSTMQLKGTIRGLGNEIQNIYVGTFEGVLYSIQMREGQSQ